MNAKKTCSTELQDKLKRLKEANRLLREQIKELEAQEAKGCDGCKYNYDIDNFDSIDGKRLDSFRPNECYVCSRNMNDRYEKA